MVYHRSPKPQHFNDVTLFYHYSTLPTNEQQSFLQTILAPGVQSLPVADIFPITLFTKSIQPIISLISHILGDDDVNIANKATLGFLRKMMQPGHLFDILAYLSEARRFQLHHFPTTSYLRYYSLLFYLFVYTHVDEFECLGINLMACDKKRKFGFDSEIVVRKRPDFDGYSQFISTYMAIAYKFIHGFSPPEFFPTKKRLSNLAKTPG